VSLEPEPARNPNGQLMTDPPAILRRLMSFAGNRLINPQRRAKRRARTEAARLKAGVPHRVEYFHQHDDPYSHLAQQVLETLQERYEIELVIHQIRASGGKNQPELAKLDAFARRDAEMIAPHYGLMRPSEMSERWDKPAVATALDAGSARLAELGHYSGAMFHYGGEWFWGVDRLFYLEQWLRDLGACKKPTLPYICPRPAIDVSGVDASHLTLDFYPSLNSPYTAIIHDLTVTMARACGIRLNHKPVLPMIMRGVPATRQKGIYILSDAKREAEHLGVDFGPAISPIGEPTRQIYSLIPWAREQGKDIALLSSALRLSWAEGVGLHRRRGLRMAVERAGLDWDEAQRHLGSEGWKDETARRQLEMTEELGLWGVPSFRLRGGEQGSDLCVWGQDRLWLVAAEIRRRCSLLKGADSVTA
jgi:2-hydroxychromene-2-carboxylate isomerase